MKKAKNTTKSIRKVIYCSEEMAEIIKEYSDKMAISESAFLSMCLHEYHKQQRVVNGFTELDKIVNRLEKLEGKVSKTQKSQKQKQD